MQEVGIIEENGLIRAGFYEKFIKEFGEDIHGLFFGLIRNKNAKDKILKSAFTPEIIKETFPKGYGVKKSLQTSA